MKELEQLSTSELYDILREELDKDVPDREKVLAILSELEARDPTNSENRPDGIIEDYTEVVNNRRCIKDSPVLSKNKHKTKKWISTMVAAAAVAIVLLVVVPEAAGAQNIFEIIGRWTEDLFRFSNADEVDEPSQEPTQEMFSAQTENEGLLQLHDEVVNQGVTESVVPTWLPEGYELKELKTFTESSIPKIHAYFAMDEKYLQISIEIHSSETTNEYPKDDTNVITYESGNVFYQIVPNEDTWKAMWTKGNIECAIITNDTEDILYKVLNSIQGRI